MKLFIIALLCTLSTIASASDDLLMKGTELQNGNIVIITNYASQPGDKVQCGGNAKVALGIRANGSIVAACWKLSSTTNEVQVKWGEDMYESYDANKFEDIDVQKLQDDIKRQGIQEMQV